MYISMLYMLGKMWHYAQHTWGAASPSNVSFNPQFPAAAVSCNGARRWSICNRRIEDGQRRRPKVT